jgi:hypothetical protein
MQLDASLGEAEVHRVHPGQPVIVRVEAYADLRLPGAVARVGSLARASIDRPLDDKRFDVAIELAPTAVDLRPGMTARGDIVVGTRANVLLLPTGAVAERQGRFVTEVVGRSGLEIRPVDLGESNDAFVEVRAGLRDGEQVALGGPGAAGGTR